MNNKKPHLLRMEDIEPRHRQGPGNYEFFLRPLIPPGAARQCAAAIYELPPQKANYPYHYHTKNEESFYIISGTGLLRTPEGRREVGAGDFIFFPTGPEGAHKLTNTSQTETLVYIDFDTQNDLELCCYPHSGKVGVYGPEAGWLFHPQDERDYYDGEPGAYEG